MVQALLYEVPVQQGWPCCCTADGPNQLHIGAALQPLFRADLTANSQQKLAGSPHAAATTAAVVTSSSCEVIFVNKLSRQPDCKEIKSLNTVCYQCVIAGREKSLQAFTRAHPVRQEPPAK
jgi:hypothetical protein